MEYFMKYFDCWLRPIDKKEYARIQQRKELYEKGLGRVFVFLDVDGFLILAKLMIILLI